MGQDGRCVVAHRLGAEGVRKFRELERTVGMEGGCDDCSM